MDDDSPFSNLIQFLCVQVRSGMALTYGCWVPLFGREWEHHILVGAPDSSLGVGRRIHVQLGSAALSWLYHALCDGCSRTGENANLRGCTYLLQLWMWERFPIARLYHREPAVCTHLRIFIMHILC
jgi:hypothetical protein